MGRKCGRFEAGNDAGAARVPETDAFNAERRREYRRIIAKMQARGKVRDWSENVIPPVPEAGSSRRVISGTQKGEPMRNKRTKKMAKSARVPCR